MENTFKTPGTVLGRNLAQSYSVKHGGLPREAGQKAGWASAWWLDPTVNVARMPAQLRARRARRRRGHCAQPAHGGTLTDGKVFAGELMGTTGGCRTMRAEAGLTEGGGRL
jgi:hypothetical protein